MFGSGSGGGPLQGEWFVRAAEGRLLADVDPWMGFHAGRNETSHTHDHEAASGW